MLKHAAGSYRKAARNYECAAELELDPFVQVLLGPMLDEMSRKIAESILHDHS